MFIIFSPNRHKLKYSPLIKLDALKSISKQIGLVRNRHIWLSSSEWSASTPNANSWTLLFVFLLPNTHTAPTPNPAHVFAAYTMRTKPQPMTEWATENRRATLERTSAIYSAKENGRHARGMPLRFKLQRITHSSTHRHLSWTENQTCSTATLCLHRRRSAR